MAKSEHGGVNHASQAETGRLLALARRVTIPADELVHLDGMTPAQVKRLKTMTTAQLKALAKRQAAARRKAVRS
jgi:hypothetical protein